MKSWPKLNLNSSHHYVRNRRLRANFLILVVVVSYLRQEPAPPRIPSLPRSSATYIVLGKLKGNWSFQSCFQIFIQNVANSISLSVDQSIITGTRRTSRNWMRSISYSGHDDVMAGTRESESRLSSCIYVWNLKVLRHFNCITVHVDVANVEKLQIC